MDEKTRRKLFPTTEEIDNDLQDQKTTNSQAKSPSNSELEESTSNEHEDNDTSNQTDVKPAAKNDNNARIYYKRVDNESKNRRKCNRLGEDFGRYPTPDRSNARKMSNHEYSRITVKIVIEPSDNP